VHPAFVPGARPLPGGWSPTLAASVRGGGTACHGGGASHH
jgi:hypothetical protein